LKYRGTLHAARGDTESAIADFKTSCGMLDHEELPLLRFIGGTAALQAGEILMKYDSIISTAFLEQAQTVFQALENCFPPEFNIESWISRTISPQGGVNIQKNDNPQTFFAY